MLAVERKLRRFRAAFWLTPQAANWVRTRASELQRQGRTFEIVLVWGRRKFRVGEMPEGDPYFAVELTDGTLERASWVAD